MATMIEQRPQRPPPALLLAVVLTFINAIGGVLLAILWPDLEDRGTIVTVSIVLGVLLVAAVLWLWGGSRWGAIATLALNGVSILLAVPAFFQDDKDILVLSALSLVLSVLVIVLVVSPQVRGYWNVRREA